MRDMMACTARRITTEGGVVIHDIHVVFILFYLLYSSSPSCNLSNNLYVYWARNPSI
uniref:Uncharacterized protein n=1 Tax=Triticum urartu TaxID=4572 RepID=A0A8R7QJS9_TRIUA